MNVKRILITILKVSIGVGLIAYLLNQTSGQAGFKTLIHGEKQWEVLALGLMFTLVGVWLGFIRWFLLLKPLQLDFYLRDAMRLGAIGFALNFISLGSVGGDLFKAILIGKEQKERRTQAVATVFADRFLGLFSMLIFASIAILCSPTVICSEDLNVKTLCYGTLACTGCGIVGILTLLFLPSKILAWFEHIFEELPFVSGPFKQLINVIHLYQKSKGILFSAFGLSLIVDLVFLSSYYFIAKGLPLETPGFISNLFIAPLSNIAGALPISPNGLGTLEAAFDYLYQIALATKEVQGNGTLVALAHRVTMILVAGLGIFFIWGHKITTAERHAIELANEE